MSMLTLKIELGCYEVKIEKAMQCLLRMEPGTWAASAVPLNYNSWKTTIRHNPLMSCTGDNGCLSCTHCSHTVSGIKTWLRVKKNCSTLREKPHCLNTRNSLRHLMLIKGIIEELGRQSLKNKPQTHCLSCELPVLILNPKDVMLSKICNEEKKIQVLATIRWC